MTQTIDDLSIEELQNRLLEIQEKIKEKEKNSLIDLLAQALRHKETAFIQELLEMAQGKKTPAAKALRPEPVEKKPSKFVGKSEVYLRGGKVFYGIQEVKYTRMDRNGILRISKDGKGLPPKVESLPAHIQRLVLALPKKKEVPPAAKVASPKPTAAGKPDTGLPGVEAAEIADDPAPAQPVETAVLVAEPQAESPDAASDAAVDTADAIAQDVTAGRTPITAAGADAPEGESQNASDVPESANDERGNVDPMLSVAISLEDPDETAEALTQVDVLEAAEAAEPAMEPVRKRKPKTRPTPE
ncbi:MAG: hypothetical protein AAB214_15605, partial [Fibrobacterota bacterium]